MGIRVPTTNDRVELIGDCDCYAGDTGVIVSGPTEKQLYRVKLDNVNSLGHPVYTYRFAREFKVITDAEN